MTMHLDRLLGLRTMPVRGDNSYRFTTLMPGVHNHCSTICRTTTDSSGLAL